MQFALLVTKLPHIEEACAHYDTLLALQPRDHHVRRAIAHALRVCRLRVTAAFGAMHR